MTRSKRGQGEGTVAQRSDGRWEARVSVEGRRRSFYGRTRAEAWTKAQDALHATRRGQVVPGKRETVGDLLAAWLEGVRGTLRPSTWSTYETYVRCHLLPELGGVRLASLRPEHVQALHRAMLDEGYSPLTVRHAHAVLHRALGQAMRWGRVSMNVAGLVDPPRAPRADLAVLDADGVRRLLRAVRGDRFEALYTLAVTAGLRRGELLALRWRDVDLERGAVRVTGTLTRADGGEMVITEPKTARSVRVVELTTLAVDALRRRQAAQAAEPRSALGLVFTSSDGTPMNPANLIHRHWLPMVERAGLPPGLRVHDLRHTAATLMLGSGTHPKVASEILGHSSVGVTLDTYSHYAATMGRAAAQAIDAALAEPEPDQ